MFGSHGSWVIVGKTHWFITSFMSDKGSCLSWSISLGFFFSKTAPHCSNPGIDFSFAVPLRCVVCPRHLNSFTFSLFFSPDQLAYLHCLNGLSCILSFTGAF